MFCESCGSKINAASKFCSSCGVPVQEDSSNPAANAEPTAVPAPEAEAAPAAAPAAEAATIAAPALSLTKELEAAANEMASASALPSEEPPAPQLPVVGPPASLVPPQAAAPAPSGDVQQSGPFGGAQPQASKRGLMLGLIAAGAAAVVIAIAAFIIVPMLGSSEKEPLIILGNNELTLKASAKAEPIALTDEVMVTTSDGLWDKMFDSVDIRWLMYELVELNEDRTKLFFIDRIKDDGSGTLYYREIDAKSKNNDGDKGVKLASGVHYQYGKTFTVNGEGTQVIYLKNYEDGGKLVVNDLTDETVIDSGVIDYYYSEDKSVIYYEKNDDGKRNLFIVSLSKPEDKTKVDSDIRTVYSFDSATAKIYYSKSDNKDEEFASYTLYSKPLDQDKKKLVSGISDLQSGIGDNDEFYYTKEVKKEVVLSSLVDDNLAAEDAKIKEPTYEEFQTTVQVPQTDWWTGETYYYEDVETDYDAYNDAYEKYLDKQSRDSLREDLKNETIEDISYDLYLFSNGKSERIASDFVTSPFSDIDSKTVVYNKKDRSDAGKVKISDIEFSSDVRAMYSVTVKESGITYIASGSAAKDIELGEKDAAISVVSMSDDNKLLYVTEALEDKKNEFVSYELSNGKPTNRKKLDEDVSSVSYISDLSKFAYYKEVNNDSGELYTLDKNGTKQKIAIDVFVGETTFYPDSNEILYMTDYNDDDNTGTLNMYKDDKNTKIATDIGAYFFTYGSELYYLSDYDNSRGTGVLMQYISKDKSEKIRDDVSAVYPTEFGYRM